jgi:O-antigen ligase
VVSLGALVMTASRGGFVAVIVSAIWGAVVFQRYVPLHRIAAIASAAAALIALVLSVMSIRYGHLLYERVVGDSTSSDMVGASSGRLEVWSNAIAAMAQAPLTLLTGFGWNVYWSMPFRLSPHNYYISLWFNLGIVGLVCGAMLLVLVIRQAIVAVRFAGTEDKPVLISFAIGAVAIAVATFFVDLYTPWLWFWAYAGLAMRIAVNATTQASKQPAESTQPQEPVPRRDPFGWIGTVRP